MTTVAPVDATTPWELIVRRHAGRVFRVAFSLTRNRDDAEDLTQDVFDRVFRNLGSYTEGNFDGWLYRITVNLFRDHVRRGTRLRLEPLREDTVDRYSTRVPDLDRTGGPVFDDDVRAALAALPPEFRIPVLLFDVEGLNYREIAAVLGVKRGTVGSRINRGRAQLRAALPHRAPRARRSTGTVRSAVG